MGCPYGLVNSCTETGFAKYPPLTYHIRSGRCHSGYRQERRQGVLTLSSITGVHPFEGIHPLIMWIPLGVGHALNTGFTEDYKHG